MTLIRNISMNMNALNHLFLLFGLAYGFQSTIHPAVINARAVFGPFATNDKASGRSTALHPVTSSSTSTRLLSLPYCHRCRRHDEHRGYYGSTALSSSVAVNPVDNNDDDDDKLPSTVTPILLTVLALIVSEGIALSTLPLHLKSIGATPVQVGMSTSFFSVAQMVCCPIIVSLSSQPQIGRRKTLSLCLVGAAMSSLVIALSSTIPLLIFARFLAGMFAAAIPVAQAGVVDLVPPKQNTLALSRVSAASQTGLVIGPIASAVVQSILRKCGVAQNFLVRGVFVGSAAFALLVLAIRGNVSDAKTAAPERENINLTSKATTTNSSNNKRSALSDNGEEDGESLSVDLSPPRYIQPMLRVIALAAGWSLTLSVAIYSLFASTFLNYGQSELSLTYSAGAATVIATQMAVVPPLAKNAGVHLSCTIGLLALTFGLFGTSVVRALPFHALFYLLIRVGQGITDTSTATLVAKASRNRQERATNLGMIQSTRAGARIFTPVLSGSLFTKSCQTGFPPRLAGTLPYLINAGLALGLTPLPMLLKRLEETEEEEKEGNE